ncbi:radical SAM protein [Peptostreptococcus equinus]|uniref:Radical SAM protein n=1 Tax=Peptostreptococcus equinus TaxID=3003601 RepID=A0ABY7JV51_9FIRM|nr:radical SAM protein [Peptostreptococcus sp. CBA3647]WAW15767.1 radical SAM protein [Peptostreptococcus sp. CBA3647]
MSERLSYLRVMLTEESEFIPMYSKAPFESDLIDQDKQAMKLEDFEKLIKYFSDRGLKKIRFVGGNPLLYKGLEELIEYSRKLGIKEIGLTTNGIGLGTKVLKLQKLGLTNVNISLDSLKEYKYQALTGGGNLKEVFLGIDACMAAKIDTKINFLVIKDFNDDEVFDFIKLSMDKQIDVRLIELLPYGIDSKVYDRGHIDLKELIKNTEGIYEIENDKLSISDYFKVEGAIGRIGIITSSNREYKEDIRRINVSNRGYMNIGQLQENEYFIKSILDNDKKMDAIIHEITKDKPIINY